jgi:serine phosphatase RsbU (regulator of sigma subunit)
MIPPRQRDSIERRYLRFLVDVGAILGEALDYRETLQRVCDAAVRSMADIATMYLIEEGEVELVAAASSREQDGPRLRQRIQEAFQGPDGPRPWIQSLVRNARPFLLESLKDANRTVIARDAVHETLLRDLAIHSLMIVPLVSESRGNLGALVLAYTDESGMQYDSEALILAEDLGRRCGMAIAKARLHAVAIDTSIRFQMSALPRSLPQFEQLRLDAFYEPAAAEMLVGGDWYDAFMLPDGRLAVSVGDVSGHGLDAAAFMLRLRDALRVALYLEGDMERALSVADLLLREEGPAEMYATASISMVDLAHRTMACLSAGHPGPLVWLNRLKGVVDPFMDRGLPLALRDLGPSAFAGQTIALDSGAFVVFFTDGLVETERNYIDGEQRLAQVMADVDVREADQPAQVIRRRVAPEHHPDDIAVLTLRFM